MVNGKILIANLVLPFPPTTLFLRSRQPSERQNQIS